MLFPTMLWASPGVSLSPTLLCDTVHPEGSLLTPQSWSVGTEPDAECGADGRPEPPYKGHQDHKKISVVFELTVYSCSAQVTIKYPQAIGGVLQGMPQTNAVLSFHGHLCQMGPRAQLTKLSSPVTTDTMTSLPPSINYPGLGMERGS